jgi:hypothetical protein
MKTIILSKLNDVNTQRAAETNTNRLIFLDGQRQILIELLELVNNGNFTYKS